MTTIILGLLCHQTHSYRSIFFAPIMIAHGHGQRSRCNLQLSSRDFYWRNISKHVRNWVHRCPHCIRFKSVKPAHWPMQIRLYQYPFRTLGVGYVSELPKSRSGNKWILTVVCPYSNYLRAIPVPDKTATTAAKAIFNDIFMLFGFFSVLQSDCGREFLNALLHRLAY